ncbi:MAG: hypothetical protein JWN64_234 [Parcubacteria group bacterium]|nr:hypothetical protein [Parcubacteria group bacterium]
MGIFNLSGSTKTQKIVKAMEPLFVERNGRRVLGKIRVETLLKGKNVQFSITANMGSHDGPVLDLKKGVDYPDDDRARETLLVLAPFSDGAIAEAIFNGFAWNYLTSMGRGTGPEGDYCEHSIGNENFARESVASIAKLADKIR